MSHELCTAVAQKIEVDMTSRSQSRSCETFY